MLTNSFFLYYPQEAAEQSVTVLVIHEMFRITQVHVYQKPARNVDELKQRLIAK